MRHIIYILIWLLLLTIPVQAQNPQKLSLITTKNANNIEAIHRLEFNDFAPRIEWSPNGNYLAINQQTKTVILNAQLDEIINFPEQIQNIIWSPNGNFFAYITTENTLSWLVIMETLNWSKVYELELPSEAICYCYLAWSPNNNYLAANFYGILMIWNFSEVPYPHLSSYWLIENEEAISNPISWSQDEKYLSGYRPVFAIQDGGAVIIKILDIENKSTFVELTGLIGANTWTSNSNLLAIVDWNQIRVIDINTQSETLRTNDLPGFPHDLAWSPDGSLLAVPISGSGVDWSIRIIDIETRDEVAILIAHSADVEHISWSADGTKIASSDRNGNVIIWGIPEPNQP